MVPLKIFQIMISCQVGGLEPFFPYIGNHDPNCQEAAEPRVDSREFAQWLRARKDEATRHGRCKGPRLQGEWGVS